MNKKIIYWAIGIFAVISVLGVAANSVNTKVKGINARVTTTPTILPTNSVTPSTIPTTYSSPTATPTQTTGLSNDNTYTNVDGNQIHSPAYSNNGSVPSGATARCGDGTYSFSQHHSGTCSHHGGVAEWL